ncbi:CIC11C00000000377 [Sungouiella intermedia]|uniref:non-specific serine/threonine protein kinase n=1 Tax=Sungouiella intermedia TaxID=45354 RepID=A0A1L0DDF6_9ASCO|nr:CIC11C00000000377 [[Candida] intermedia]
MENNHLPHPDMFHNPGFTILDAQIRELERSVSPCEIPALLEQTNTPVNPSISDQLDLRQASSNNPTVVIELDMDCNLRYVSKNWESLVGTSIKKILNKPISNILIGSTDADLHVFNDAVAQMVQDDASYKIKFVTATNDVICDDLSDSSGRHSPNPSLADTELDVGMPVPLRYDTLEYSALEPLNETLSSISSQVSNNGDVIELEAQGIMIHDPQTRLPTHSIWTIRPFVRIDLELTIPLPLVDLLGFGSEIFEGYLLNLREAGIIDEGSVPEPKTILCRICETSFPAWFIEKHSEMCLLEHKVEEELQLCHDMIADQRDLIVRISENLWSQQFESTSGSSSPLSSTSSLSSSSTASYPSLNEYKGIALPTMSTEATNAPRGNSSMGKSMSSLLSIRNSKKFPFGILHRLLEFLDEALLINPADKQDENEELQFSPNSERAIHLVMNWRPLETSDPAIRAMVQDSQKLVTDKVDILTRLLSILKYSDKIKKEVDDYVLQSVKETVARLREKTIEMDNNADRKLRGGFSNLRSRSNSSVDRSSNQSARSSDPLLPQSMISPPSMIPISLPLAQQGKLISPQPSRIRSPTSKVLDDSLYKDLDRRSPIQSVTPRDLLRTAEFNRLGSSLSPNSSYPRLKDVADSMNDLDLSKKSDSRGSSFSSPRRHLSPAPYVEKQSFSTLQRNVKNQNRLELPPLGSPANAPVYESNDLLSPTVLTPTSVKREGSATNLSLPPMTAQNANAMMASCQSPVITPTVPNRSSFTAMKPPLSPLLVSQTPKEKSTTGGIKDYEIIKAISKGAFGSVFLAKRRITGDYVAIKCLRKRDMIAKNQVLNVRSERAVMMRQTDSPYVAQLYSSFQSKDYLYLVMEYLNGGDCATLVKMLGTLGDKWAKRYIAEVIVGVEDLHSRGIIHRDLKPDNLLIDSAGHLKLTDFGLSKVGVVGRQTSRHRKSSTSENAIELFRKSVHNAQSPLVLGSSGPLDSPELISYHHKRMLSVTPFSLSPAADQFRQTSHGYLGSISSYDSSPLSSIPIKKRSGSLLRTTKNTRSESNSSESPSFHPSLPRTSSESSFAIVDDDCSMNSPMTEADNFVLYDPNEDTETNKFVGTPDYLAPETISGAVQGEYSDWWSIGCILFEFLFGYPPFHADTPEKVFKNILKGEIDWPPLSEKEELEICPPEAKDLIEGLLTVNFEDRLGYGGAKEIMSHPYFKDINWNTLYYEAPDSFIPMVDDPESTDYFDSRGADISQFPKDDSDEEIIVPQSAKEESTQSYFGNNVPTQNLSLPSTPTVMKRERRGSKLADASEFGSFHFRNLNVLEKANKDVINRLKSEHLEHRGSFSSSSSESIPIGYTKSRGLSISSTVVNPGSPFKRPVSPVANASTPSSKEKTLSKRGSFDLGTEGRPRLIAPSLSRQVLHKSFSEQIQSPPSSDNEEYSTALMRHKRRGSLLHTNSSGSTSIPMSVLSSTKSESFDLDVLYCEPIPIVRHTVAKLLEKNRCIVVAVSDGDSLIRRATSQVRFDLIFTALRLPKIEAIDAVKLIQNTSGVNSSTPVIAITGFAKEALELGVFHDVLEKPVDSTMIANVIAKYVANDVAVESDPDE